MSWGFSHHGLSPAEPPGLVETSGYFSAADTEIRQHRASIPTGPLEARFTAASQPPRGETTSGQTLAAFSLGYRGMLFLKSHPSVVDLRCCAHFCCTARRPRLSLTHAHTHTHALSSPRLVSQETGQGPVRRPSSCTQQPASPEPKPPGRPLGGRPSLTEAAAAVGGHRLRGRSARSSRSEAAARSLVPAGWHARPGVPGTPTWCKWDAMSSFLMMTRSVSFSLGKA